MRTQDEIVRAMRTQDEIVRRVREVRAGDFFGFETGDLLDALDFAHAREFLKIETTPDQWHKDEEVLTEEKIRARMADYIAFAWEKCIDHRGLSAGRSVAHFTAWCWLIGDDEAFAFVSDEKNYQMYGAPILLYLSKRYGYAVPEGVEVERMSQGQPCSSGCSGCGC